MGGDNAPAAPVEGAVLAAESLGVPVCLVGDEERLRGELERLGRYPGNLVRVRHAPGVIDAGEQPVAALRRKKDSSMVVALGMVKQGEADVLVSAGNTGALLAGGVVMIGRLRGVDRPAISTVLPTRKGKGVLLLDAGANVDSRPEHLVQFAIMGSVYASHVLGWNPVSTGLLNVGVEEGKGNDAVKQAYSRLKARSDFVGNVEGRDVLAGDVNVVICDGFVGNIFLKTLEGTAGMIFDSLREELKGVRATAGGLLLKPAFKRLKKRLDYSEYGGAPLLGLEKPVIKCHGSSGPMAFMNGCRVAVEFASSGAIDALAQEIQVMSNSEGGL
ncbi:MAG: phosphate acyltransferase PlsX [Ignavibacteriales bacterium]